MSGRFKLEGGDIMPLMITTMAAGIHIPGIETEAMLEILPGFFDICKSTLGDDPQTAANKVYADIQCTLMAYRKDDFITIQKEPPFRKQGKANFISLLTAYNEGGKDKLRVAIENMMKFGNQSSFDEAPIRYSGGSGLSINDAVIILTTDGALGVAVEYWYLNYTYGRVNKRGQSLRDGGNGKHYDCVSFDTPSGEAKSVYFDISNFYGR